MRNTTPRVVVMKADPGKSLLWVTPWSLRVTFLSYPARMALKNTTTKSGEIGWFLRKMSPCTKRKRETGRLKSVDLVYQYRRAFFVWGQGHVIGDEEEVL